MNVKIYGIGGRWNNILVGTAHDALTARRLLRLLMMEGVQSCSLHGPLREGAEAHSGEMPIEHAQRLFDDPRVPRQEFWLVTAHTGEYGASVVLGGFTSSAAAEASRRSYEAQLRARGLDKYDNTRAAYASWFHGLTVDYNGARVRVSGPFPLET